MARLLLDYPSVGPQWHMLVVYINRLSMLQICYSWSCLNERGCLNSIMRIELLYGGQHGLDVWLTAVFVSEHVGPLDVIPGMSLIFARASPFTVVPSKYL